MSGWRASPHRTTASLNFSIFSPLSFLFPFLSTYFFFLYLTWKINLISCHLIPAGFFTSKWKDCERAFSTSVLLTTLNLCRKSGARATVPFLSPSFCACVSPVISFSFFLRMLFTELVLAPCLTLVSLCVVLWRWAQCVNQSDSGAIAWLGQRGIKGVKWHPHGAYWGHLTLFLHSPVTADACMFTSV